MLMVLTMVPKSSVGPLEVGESSASWEPRHILGLGMAQGHWHQAAEKFQDCRQTVLEWPEGQFGK